MSARCGGSSERVGSIPSPRFRRRPAPPRSCSCTSTTRLTMLRLASELGPSLPLPYMWRMWIELNTNRYDSAQQAARQGAQAAGLEPQLYAALIRGVADPARRRAALNYLESIPDSAPWNLNAAYHMNWLILLGDDGGRFARGGGIEDPRDALFGAQSLEPRAGSDPRAPTFPLHPRAARSALSWDGAMINPVSAAADHGAVYRFRARNWTSHRE